MAAWVLNKSHHSMIPGNRVSLPTMLGRISCTYSVDHFGSEFRISEIPSFCFEPRDDVSPLNEVPIVRLRGARRAFDLMSWGFMSRRSRSLEAARPVSFVCGENVDRTRLFRNAFHNRRCLIPCTGFFEWRVSDENRELFFIRHRDCELLALAGLWELWNRDEKSIHTFVVLTTWPNHLISTISTRMPVIVPPFRYDTWLCEGQVEHPNEILRPAPDGELVATRVS